MMGNHNPQGGPQLRGGGSNIYIGIQLYTQGLYCERFKNVNVNAMLRFL